METESTMNTKKILLLVVIVLVLAFSIGFVVKNNHSQQAAAIDSQGAQNTLVIPLTAPGYTPYTPISEIQTDLSNLNNYVTESSLGKATVNSTIATGNWVSLAYDPCGVQDPTWINDAIAAVDPGVNFNAYNRILFIRESPACTGSAEGNYYPRSFVTADGTVNLYWAEIRMLPQNFASSYNLNFYLQHEFGHTLGAGHAGTLFCQSSSFPADINNTSDCTNTIYGNMLEVMSQGGIGHSQGLMDMALFGTIWGPSNVQTITTPGTYAIDARETANANIKGLKIPITSSSGFYLESRKSLGAFDSQITGTNAFTGVLVYYYNDALGYGIYDTKLLALPGVTSYAQAAFQAGQTFSAVNGINFTVTNVSSSGATVQINNVGSTASDTTPPTVSLIAPANNATVSGTAVTVSANASDNVAVSKVDFYAGTTLLGTDTTLPYSLAWNTTTANFPNGTYVLSARATDTTGNVGISSNVTVTILNAIPDTTPPVVAITTPANNAHLNKNGSTTLSASAADPSGVAQIRIYFDTVLKIACPSAASCSTTINNHNISAGSHTVGAEATDGVGNVSARVSRTVTK